MPTKLTWDTTPGLVPMVGSLPVTEWLDDAEIISINYDNTTGKDLYFDIYLEIVEQTPQILAFSAPLCEVYVFPGDGVIVYGAVREYLHAIVSNQSLGSPARSPLERVRLSPFRTTVVLKNISGRILNLNNFQMRPYTLAAEAL